MTRSRLGSIIAITLIASTLAVADVAAGPVATGPIGEVYVEKSKTIRPFKRATVKVACPKGRPVLSGGTLVTGTALSLSVASNGPADGRDRNKKPDDAWKGSINNGTPDPQIMTVRAQCGAKEDRPYVRYMTKKSVIGPGAASDTRMDCEAPYIATGGGVVISGKSMNAPLLSTMPFDGQDGGSVRDDSWVSFYVNRSGKRVREIATTICADPNALGALGGLVTVPTVAIAAPASTQTGGNADCPAGDVALGGGVGEFTEPPGTSITFTVASIIQRFTGPVPTGWRGWMNNGTAVNEMFNVAAVCFDPFL